MFVYKEDKYIIFLQDRFFTNKWFKFYKKTMKSLENNGITVISITDINQYQSNRIIHKYPNINLLFDDKIYPQLNCLYIHLYNGMYFNDTIYIKKKIEKEREMLLLLAGKLGVREMTYSSIITETSISNIKAEIIIKGLDNKIQYTKNKIVIDSTTGKEVYQNRGAAVYINSKSKEEVDLNILNSLSKMKSNVFSYDYYKNSSKLESFVYKRYIFKMLHLEYTIDVEDISDKSFIVKSCLMTYGLGFCIDKNNSYTEMITFTFDFFSDKELRIQLLENVRQETDDFINIREVYDESLNKDLAVHYIANYVRNKANELKYKCKYEYENKNYKYLLNKWILNNDIKKFYEVCHQFTNSIQIKNWIIEISEIDRDTVSTDSNKSEDSLIYDSTRVLPDNIMRREGKITRPSSMSLLDNNHDNNRNKDLVSKDLVSKDLVSKDLVSKNIITKNNKSQYMCIIL